MEISLLTEVVVCQSNRQIDHQAPMLLMGSCFTDNIGLALTRLKFPVSINPFGVIYNPLSIANSLRTIMQQKTVSDSDLVYDGGLWHSMQFHGSFSDHEKFGVISKTNDTIQKAHHFLKNAGVLMITFGTAWVYNYKKSNEIVANCHKIKSNEFDRFRLNVDQIVDDWMPLLAELRVFNPKLQLVFTVSPIRHLKDGAHGNQISKATLLLAIDKLLAELDNPVDYNYFPSYEIVNDELRDYRFYAADMIHLNETAIHFLFEKFKHCFFSNETRKVLTEVSAIAKAVEHRMLTNNPSEKLKFKQSMLKKIEKMNQMYPFIDFRNEKKHFENL